MTKLERRIWAAYLDETPNIPERWTEDFAVGTPPEIPAGYESIALQRVAWLWQKRIDVVGYFPNRHVIYEVKPRLNMMSLGQLISYRQMYRQEVHPDLPVEMVVVTPLSDPDLFPIFLVNGVGVHIVKGML